MNLKNFNTDSMTGLPYAEEFKAEATGLIKGKINNAIILSLDISNFKYFNQMYGYEIGDELIKRTVNRYCHENEDCVLAYRIYVDHVILLIDYGNMDIESLRDKYDSMNRAFADEINHEYPLARIRIYIGVYVIDDRDEKIELMIDKAQYARRSIKTNYAYTIAMYSEDMQVRTQEQASIIPMFFSALENNRMEVYIQPKFSIKDQKLIGGEALSRIMDPDGNVIPPGAYIDILENSGLISILDDFVIRKVVELQKKWMEEGKELVTISLNLSRMDFWENGFIRRIDELIEKSGVPTKYFEFELTETIFCENLALVTRQINFLRQRGYKISMDDFGSGYNSLYMLGTVPVDIIKFDRGFVLNSLNVDTGRRIMKNLMTTFKDVDFEVICEGIENKEEENIVYDCGCDAVQGYLHDRPLPYAVFADKYLKSN